MNSIRFIIIFLLLPVFTAASDLNDRSSVERRIEITVVGDLMCHTPQMRYARSDTTYDFSDNYKYVKDFFTESDFTIGNLETTLAGEKRGYSGYPLFNAPDEFLTALKDAGFDLLITANNHSLDKHKKGLIRTIDEIRKAGLHNSGTYKSQNERDSIYLFDLNGIKFTLLSYTYGTNGIPLPKNEDYLVNLIDEGLIRNDIKYARTKEPDIIIVYYHFGDEYKQTPSDFQKEIVEKTIDFGADIILGSHPHVPQPLEYFKTINGNLDSGFVAYSLGNFISNQRWRYSDSGPLLKFSIIKDVIKDSVYLNNVRVIPTWVFKGYINDEDEYLVLPSDSIYSGYRYYFLSENDELKMKQSYNDIKSIMSKNTGSISFYSPSESLKNLMMQPFPAEIIPINRKSYFELVEQ